MTLRAWLPSVVVVSAAIFAIVGVHALTAMPPNERADDTVLDVTVLYVGADDCAPCRSWQSGDGAAFRASPEFSRLTYREVKSPSLLEVLKDEIWPDDLRRYRDRIGRGAGVPMWMVIVGGDIVSRGFGPTQWRQTIWPKVKSLVH